MRAQDIIVQRVKQTLRDICSEQFNCDLELDGLIGITLGKKDVFLVKINEVIAGADETRASPITPYQNSPVPLTDDHEGMAINIPSKRHCAQSRMVHSPKRRKPEDQDDSEPQDLSQRTHSPSRHDFHSADSNSRDSPAAVVRIPSTESNNSNAQWKGPDHMEHEDNPQQQDVIEEVTTNLANQNMTEPTADTSNETIVTKAAQQVMAANKAERGPLKNTTNPNTTKDCFQCRKLQSNLAKMKNELLAFHKRHEYYTIGENPKPRPGCVPPTVADHYKMKAFVSGSGVFVYDDDYRKLMQQLHKSMNNKSKGSKPPASWLAFELLSMFYNKEKYKQPVIEPVEPAVRDSIITLAIKEGTGNKGVVSAALDKQMKKIRDEMDDVKMIPGQPIYPYVLAAPPPPMPPAPHPAAIRPPTRNNTPHVQGPPAHKPQSLQGLPGRLSMVGSSSAPSSPPGRRREEGRGESTWPPPSRSDRIWGPDSDPQAGPSDRPGPEHDASYYRGEPGFLDQPWRTGAGGPGAGVGRGGPSRDQDRERDMRDLWPRNDRSPGPIGRPVPSTSHSAPPRRGGAGGVGAPGPARGYSESTDRYWRC